VKIESGTTLGPYEIVGRLGAGGMGEVWRARDTRLGRDVAIKILAPDFAGHAQHHARFVREARAISQLEHPHICRLYDVGADGRDLLGRAPSGGDAGAPDAPSLQYLVMECLEGETLAERLTRGPLPVHDVFRYGQQIASALEAAHRKNIVHRDLKPGNVMLTRSGAKLLDFGLAKNQVSLPGVWAADGPTIAHPASAERASVTAEGTIVGTLQYMAPEQLEGRESDHRTDVFALGVVLYEMATGRRAFRGASQASLIGAILTAQPEPIVLADAAAPVGLDRVVRKCLEKHPDDRWQSAGDIAGQLQWVGELSSATTPLPAVQPRARWRRLAVPLSLAAVLGLAAGGALGWTASTPSGPAAAPTGSVVRSQIALPPGIRLAGWGPPTIALSPDGRHLAVVGHDGTMQRLYVRRLDREEFVAVPGSESAEGPFFSPDSRFIGFAVAVSSMAVDLPSELRRVSVDGGLPQTVCPLADFFGGTWSSDGHIYFVDVAGEGLWKVPASGGEPSAVLSTPLTVRFPSVAPDGRTILATASTEQAPLQLVAIDAPSGAVRDLGISGTSGTYLSTGHLLYMAADRRLTAVPFDLPAKTASGRGAVLLDDLAVTGSGEAVIAVAQTGTLLYAQGFVSGSNRELTRVWRSARDGTSTTLPFEPDTYSRRGISVSPDGSRIATTTWDGRLWIGDLHRGTRLSLPQPAGTTRLMPLWTPDGKSLVFAAMGAGLDAIHMFIQPTDGSSPARQLTTGFERPFEAWPTSWASPTRLVFNHFSLSGIVAFQRTEPGVGTLAVDPEGAAPEPLLVRRGTAHLNGRVSPDGRWLLYQARDRDRPMLLVRRLDLQGGPVSVSADGVDGRWAPDGREIFFRIGDRIMAASFDERGVEPHPGTPRVLFEVAGLSAYDPIPGSRDFIVLAQEPASGVRTSLSMVQHWFREFD
jgi:eukaryotic-like serine/threonine-protein kinase